MNVILGAILTPLFFVGPVYLGWTYFGAWGVVVAIFAILGAGFGMADD